MQCIGGAREAAELRNCNESTQLAKRDIHSVFI
jgi:hypothetical protein